MNKKLWFEFKSLFKMLNLNQGNQDFVFESKKYRKLAFLWVVQPCLNPILNARVLSRNLSSVEQWSAIDPVTAFSGTHALVWSSILNPWLIDEIPLVWADLSAKASEVCWTSSLSFIPLKTSVTVCISLSDDSFTVVQGNGWGSANKGKCCEFHMKIKIDYKDRKKVWLKTKT